MFVASIRWMPGLLHVLYRMARLAALEPLVERPPFDARLDTLAISIWNCDAERMYSWTPSWIPLGARRRPCVAVGGRDGSSGTSGSRLAKKALLHIHWSLLDLFYRHIGYFALPRESACQCVREM